MTDQDTRPDADKVVSLKLIASVPQQALTALQIEINKLAASRLSEIAESFPMTVADLQDMAIADPESVTPFDAAFSPLHATLQDWSRLHARIAVDWAYSVLKTAEEISKERPVPDFIYGLEEIEED